MPAPLSTALEDEGEPISIHGQAGQPRPVIHTQAEYGVEILAPTSSLSDVDIEDAVGHFGVYVNENGAANVDHVVSHVSAAGAIACYPAGTLTDSVCWSSGPNGIAETVLVAGSVTATLRNDTMIASGAGGTAVAVNSSTSSTMTINLINSIARGAGTDIFASTDTNPKTAAIVNADHSNYATVQLSSGGGGSTISVTPAGSGTNQQGAPSFVNAAAGDFRELAGSTSTIDRGGNSDSGRQHGSGRQPPRPARSAHLRPRSGGGDRHRRLRAGAHCAAMRTADHSGQDHEGQGRPRRLGQVRLQGGRNRERLRMPPAEDLGQAPWDAQGQVFAVQVSQDLQAPEAGAVQVRSPCPQRFGQPLGAGGQEGDDPAAAMRMRAAVLEEFGEPLAVQEVELAEPQAGEALVRLVACGVCHTDLYTASGADPSGYAPAVLGHEGGGVVEAIGPDVTPLAAR